MDCWSWRWTVGPGDGRLVLMKVVQSILMTNVHFGCWTVTPVWWRQSTRKVNNQPGFSLHDQSEQWTECPPGRRLPSQSVIPNLDRPPFELTVCHLVRPFIRGTYRQTIDRQTVKPLTVKPSTVKPSTVKPSTVKPSTVSD
ncbi:hypothetical protein BV898_01802 [Hypsibius exemplaris]|uniref:Uncharacterized protein n=1 Tax=Hypsibius exemplaris TaxID=2072580 RepID=A0A1W0XAB8_HYPEX|nr:hypothetical protein BV898_01802 [Hypsibius exemplaris]